MADGTDTTWKLHDPCVAQWTNGLFYHATISRVLEEPNRNRYAVTSQDNGGESIIVAHDQLRKVGDRPYIRVNARVEEKKALELTTDVMKSSKCNVPAAAINYTASLILQLINEDRCLDIDSWFFRLSPLLLHSLEVAEDVIWRVCNSLIKKLVPLVGAKDGDKRRLSSEVHGKDDDVLLQVNKLTLGYMGKILLIRTRMRLLHGHRYGIVGENGAGKTTLMRKIASGELPGFPKWIKTVYVQPDFDTEHDYTTAFNYLKAAQLEEQGPNCDISVVNTLMDDLHFTEKLRNSLIKELSGGWKMRVSLARATMMRADILLLDEPTNHLDVSAVKWLETYLRGVPNTVMVISHEPAFLDRVATDILFMKNQKLHPYVGNFSQFTAQQSGFTAQNLEDSAMSGASDALRFRFPDPGELIGITSKTRAVMTMKNVVFAYDPKKGNVLKGVKGKLTLSSRIAVVGPNGAGKSTMVKLLVGELDATTGSIWRHLNLRISYVAQHSFDHLEKVRNRPALNYIRQRFIRGFDSENSAYHHSAEDMFKATDAQSLVGRTVEQILGRRKFKNSVAYEVKWHGYPESENTWETETRLRELGAHHLARQCDEKIRSKKSGIDQRPLTNKEIIRHLGDFGLDKQYANAKIEGLSGGQKCKLVLAGAMWNKPHFLVLDEPTNYLDLDALGALATAINRYKGGIIMVSHNQDFIAKICNEQWNMNDGVFDVVDVKQPEQVEEEEEENIKPAVDKGYDGRLTTKATDANLPSGLGKLLGEEGVLSKNMNVKREALSELVARQAKNNFGGMEARDRVFRNCLDLMAESNDELWGDTLTLATSITHSVEGVSDQCLALLSYIAEYSSTLKDSAESLQSKATKEQTAIAQKFSEEFHVGERVSARYADGEWYPAEILQVKPRGHGFQINYLGYNEVANLKTTDVKKMKDPANEKLRAPVSQEAKQAEQESAVVNRTRAGVLIIKASLAAGLPLKNNKDTITATAMDLIEALSNSNVAGDMSMTKATSETRSVQLSMEYALSDLLTRQPSLGLDSQQLMEEALDSLVKSDKLNVRIGAAHCLAGLCSGFGFKSFKEFGMMDRLKAMSIKTATEEEKSAVLMVFPRLARSLGNLFEYNIVEFLPVLLAALSDRNKNMQEKARASSRALMASISIHGARLILPHLLEGLNSKDWKVKVNNVQVLESVAYCSEELMSAQLPNVVPQLMEVMANPRKEVRLAAESAFDQIGGVIANPEIKPLVPALMDAVRDPSKNTHVALEKLTHTSFAHAVDSPSLAILMPIVFNGMKDRKIESKKAAMKVVAALCALIVDVKFLAPYADDLLAKLKGFLFYSMPDVRDVASKALGTLYNEMGEDYFPDLMDYLVESLKGDNVSPHQVAGAAKGLCYCTYALGIPRTLELLPNLLEQTKSDLPNVRAGHLELFVVMPEVFGDAFRFNFLTPVFPFMLQGIADSVLMVQEAAMLASQELVSRHARTDLGFMLPFIMDGLKHKDPKVRTSHIQLLGTLFLNLVVDTNFSQTVKFWGHGNSLAEDEIANKATKEQEEIIKQYMGEIVRNETFAELYLMRSDSQEGVASMAWRVWMLVIPRERDLLELLLDILVDSIVESLSSSEDGLRKKGRTALGILVQSMGDRGLARIVPMLHHHLKSEDGTVRKAVAFAFGEVMRSAGKGDIGAYLNDIIPSIRDMLCDPVKEVRPAAGGAFAQLYKNVGQKAIDRIAPLLLETVHAGEVSDALVDGVTLVLSKCDMNGYFNLAGRILTSLKPITEKTSVHYMLREYLVGELCGLTKNSEGMQLVRSFKLLQRHAEEEPEIAYTYIDRYIDNAASRVMDQRGNIRNSARQLLFHGFRYQLDAAKGENDLKAYFKNKDMKTEELADLVGYTKAVVPETEVKETVVAPVEDEPKEVEVAAQADSSGPVEKLGKDEKRCGKCKKVLKVKSYSKKQFKSPTGVCRMCS